MGEGEAVGERREEERVCDLDAGDRAEKEPKGSLWLR